MEQKRDFLYDVCLSFAGEDRAYVDQFAWELKSLGIAAFYDRYEQSDLWGKDLYTHLDEVYRTKARFCVMFISTSYAQKLWTNHERKSAQARAFEENREYILPVRFDETPIPGVLPTTGYISALDFTPKELAQMLSSKLGSARERVVRPKASPQQFRRIYYEGFDSEHLSEAEVEERLGKLWLVGQRGAWTGELSSGLYHVRNTDYPDATLNNRITYSEQKKQIDLGDSRVSVKVKVSSPNDAHSGAGIMFRATAKSESFYSFLLQPGGVVSFAETRVGRLNFLWSTELPSRLVSDFVTLRVTGRGSDLQLAVGDETLHTIEGVRRKLGAPGCHTLSVGNFYFDDFSIFMRTP